MPLTDFLQVNDVGVALKITVVNSDGITPIDLSGASLVTIYILKPNNSLVIGTCSFVTNGSDGQVQYVNNSGDLNPQGYYKIQITYTIGTNLKHTQTGSFLVEPNLPGVN